ncbi:MAG: hypothetical protein ABI896_06045 [Actinomycetota bacterium]
MALKTFTASRAPAAGDGKCLQGWYLSSGGVALVVNFCNGPSAAPTFQVQLPVNSSSSQAYPQPMPVFPNGCHVEVVSGTLNRGAIDI